jgi:hypothetical protein
LIRLDGVETGEDHRLDLLKAGEGHCRRARSFRDRVADLHVGDGLDGGGQEADFADAEFVNQRRARPVHADGLHLIVAPRIEEANLHAGSELAVDDAEQDDDAAIRVVPRIEDERLERRGRVTLRRRHVAHNRFKHFSHTRARLCARQHRVTRV